MNSDILRRNNITVRGRGQKAILMAHGFGCDQNVWRFIAPAFEDDFRVVLFDYVGAGKSDLGAYSSQRYSDLKGYARDITEICDALELTDAIFVGHSVSGMIGLLASIERTDIFERLVMISPSPRYLNDLPGYVGGFELADVEELLAMMEKNDLGWASYLAPVAMQNADQPALALELEGRFCATDPQIAREFARATFYADNRNDLPQVKTPSLILQCQEDLIAPLEVGNYMHRHLTQNTLRILEASGHCSHMSHPQEIIEAIQQYLSTPLTNLPFAGGR